MLNVINALVRIFFLKVVIMVRQLSQVFVNATILSRVWEWSSSGTNTRLRTRLRSEATLSAQNEKDPEQMSKTLKKVACINKLV